jgi:hypothetical protein
MFHILIDYENVQPDDIDLLAGRSCRVLVFLGPIQKKLPVDFVMALQSFGDRAEYVLLETSGRNALDMAIAWALGGIYSRDPSARAYVISKDADYDPLIRHVAGRKFIVERYAGLAELPFLKADPRATHEDLVLATSEFLQSRKATMPASERTLRSTLHAHFDKKLAEDDLNRLIVSLVKNGVVAFEGKKKKAIYPSRINHCSART